MNLLLDTCALLWFLSNHPQLSATARTAIEDPANARWVSPIRLLEIALKVRIGKLPLQRPFGTLFPAEPTHPAIYYCGANWHPGEPAGGYCGIQHNSPRERRTIFSVPTGGQRSVATIGGGLNSFLENFAGKDKSVPKLALYRLWLGSTLDALRPLTRANGDGAWGRLHDSYFLAEGAPERVNKLFLELEDKYGKPDFGGQGRSLRPISDKAVPAEVTRALKRLQRAEAVQDKSDAPRVGELHMKRTAQ